MGSIVIKPNRDEDLYLIWSSIVDAPTYYGSREELLDDEIHWLTPEHIDRADATSSSSLIFPETWDKDWSLIFMNSGSIPRSRMKALLEVLLSRPDDGREWEDPNVLALLDPFED